MIRIIESKALNYFMILDTFYNIVFKHTFTISGLTLDDFVSLENIILRILLLEKTYSWFQTLRINQTLKKIPNMESI